MKKVGDKVKHVKSDSKNHWYKKLNDGVIEQISKSGKSAVVRWFDAQGRCLHWARYSLDALVQK